MAARQGAPLEFPMAGLYEFDSAMRERWKAGAARERRRGVSVAL